jgi:ammonium transporter Rh
MIFVGFGFLMVFLKNNSWTSIGFNYLIAAWAIQIGPLYKGFWVNVCSHYFYGPDYKWEMINLDIEKLIVADFGAATVLITFGALLGKCNLFQLWVIATIEVFIFMLNDTIIYKLWEVSDIGGSMVIHTYGAYFGLSCALFYQPKAAIADKGGIGKGNYLSDLVSMIGTLFLFCYWPSFNAAPALTAIQAQRTFINTYLAIACSCVAAIIVSKTVHHGKLEMEIVLNASIAGGVGIGATADIIVRPFGAMIVGFICGAVSAFGYAYLSKFLQKAINLHDTCGVHNLHGMPGVIGGITSAIIVSFAEDNFGEKYYEGSFGIDGNSPSTAAGYQLAALALSLGLAIGGGLFTGFITSRQWFQPLKPEELFDDRA